MKRICIVLPKLTAGGTERTAAELANYLVSMNIDVSILLMYKITEAWAFLFFSWGINCYFFAFT